MVRTAVLVATLTMGVASAAEPRPPQVFAVVAGVNTPVAGGNGLPEDVVTPLRYAERDAEQLAAGLCRSGYPADHVTLLLGPKATAAAIRQAVDSALRRLGKDDLLVIALSGHGMVHRKVTWFCPAGSDADRAETLVSVDGLFESLQASAAGKKVLVVDSCRRQLTRQFVPKVEPGLAAKGRVGVKPAAGPAWLLFSCKEGEVAAEDDRLGDNQGHGVFFYHLIEAIRGRAATGSERSVSLVAAFDYVCAQVAKSHGGKQTPQLNSRLNDTWLVDCVPTLNQTATLAGHGELVKFIRFLPDGRALTSDRHVVHIWDVAARRRAGELPRQIGFNHPLIAASAGTADVAVGFNPAPQQVRSHNLATGESRAGGREDRAIESLAVSPGGRFVAAGLFSPNAGGPIVRLYDTKTLAVANTLMLGGNTAQFLSFSHDGRRLACGSFADRRVRVLDVLTGAMAGEFEFDRGILHAVTIDPRGSEVVIVTSDAAATIQVWKWDQPGQPQMSLSRSSKPETQPGERQHIANCGAVSADGRLAASGCVDDGSVVFWDTTTMLAISRHKRHRTRVHSVAIAADCSAALSGGDRGELVVYSRN